MKLDFYLRTNGINGSQFALAIKVSRATANRLIRGLRKPNEEVAGRIYALTNGQVAPNDFYDLPNKKLKSNKPRSI